MAGIYIPGMAMPTSCRECWLKMNCDDCEGWECYCLPLQDEIGYLKDLLTDKRRDDCPLVPVPDHGDLIERDRAVHELVFDYAYAAADLVKKLPTIIPADKEGETT